MEDVFFETAIYVCVSFHFQQLSTIFALINLPFLELQKRLPVVFRSILCPHVHSVDGAFAIE